MRPRGFILLALGALVLGLVAERAAYRWDDLLRWVPDLLTGWTLVTCGLAAWWRRPESRVGMLLAAAGFSWFAGNFAAVHIAAIAWLAAHAIYLYRGPLVHALVGYPTGRASGPVDRATVVGGYAAAAVSAVWANDAATIMLATLLLLVSARSYLRSVGPMRRAHRLALWATGGLVLVLAGQAAVRLAAPSARADDLTLLAIEAALCGVAVTLLAGLLAAGWERAAVTDLVVELGHGRPVTLRDELAHALGDPTLEVGYRLPGRDGFVDPAGVPLTLPVDDTGRAVTVVERDGELVAALVHDRAVLDDPGLVEAVLAATRLSAWNARLRAEVLDQAAEVRRSRRRILAAADEERRRLESRLHEGAERRLMELGDTLRRAGAVAHGGTTAERIERARHRLERAVEELRELALGLHPRVLSERGLAGALATLAERANVPVGMAVAAPRLAPELEATVWFVCSETLANVEKYAEANGVTVSVATKSGRLRVEVVDDGRGGADPASGSGLRGLADRVESVGGTFTLESPAGLGTRIVVELPLESRSVDLPPGPAAPEDAVEDSGQAGETEVAAVQPPRAAEKDRRGRAGAIGDERHT